MQGHFREVQDPRHFFHMKVENKEPAMREPEPSVQTVKISEVKANLSGLVHEVSRNATRVLVEERGRPVAAIISIEDLQRFSQLERERDERFAVIDRMREAFRDVPSEEIEREAERSVAEARERLRERAAEATARTA
jgi:prevent-host-death family protein